MSCHCFKIKVLESYLQENQELPDNLKFVVCEKKFHIALGSIIDPRIKDGKIVKDAVVR